jgi:hypothetical protein
MPGRPLDARGTETLVRVIEIPRRGDRRSRQAPSESDAERTTVLRPLLIVIAAFFALLGAAPAQAEGLLSGALPGLVSPSDTPSVCNTSASQPFARWGDTSYYVLVPGGSFESGATGWKLSGGAKVAAGNETYYVHSARDRYSLYLPAGSQATSPPMCFAAGDWNARFFTAGSGTLRVKVVVKSLLGVLSILDGGTVSSGSSWKPSPELRLTLTNVCGLVATDSISLRFVPANTAGIRIDDVYLDPWRSL